MENYGTNRGRDGCDARTVGGLARKEAAEWLQGKEPKKVVYVEKKLINFVV